MFNKKIRVLSLDPGCTFTGASVLDFYLDGKIHALSVETIKSEKLIAGFKDFVYTYGERFTKIMAISQRIITLLEIYKPDVVVCESPFYNKRRPQAYGALVEVLSMFRTYICTFDSSLPFETIPPSNVKQAVGVYERSGDKDLMRQALAKLPILYEGHLKPVSFDEHSVDSICVGIGFYKQIEKY